MKSLFALLLLIPFLAGCSGDEAVPATPSPSVTPESSPTTTATSIPLTPSPTIAGEAVNVYRNDAMAFEFTYPRSFTESQQQACQPLEARDGSQLTFGNNVNIRVEDAAGQDVGQVSEAFLEEAGARSESSESVIVGGLDGLRIPYRLIASGRFGIATFVVHSARAYVLVFEARDLQTCGGPTENTNLYESIVRSFRFLP